MRPVVVDIENVVLKGFRFEDRHAIAGALQDELARLLAAPEMAEKLARLGEAPRLRVDDVKIEVTARPQQVGAETARAIGRGLMK